LPAGADVEFTGGVIARLASDAVWGRLVVDLPLGGRRAKITFPSGAFVELEFDAGDVVEVVEPPHGEVRVQVTDTAGRAVRGEMIVARSWRGSGAAPDGVEGWDAQTHGTVSTTGYTDASGRVTLRGVLAGDVLVQTLPVPWMIPAAKRLALGAGDVVEVELGVNRQR
jgi:hypothetical protein